MCQNVVGLMVYAYLQLLVLAGRILHAKVWAGLRQTTCPRERKKAEIRSQIDLIKDVFHRGTIKVSVALSARER